MRVLVGVVVLVLSLLVSLVVIDQCLYDGLISLLLPEDTEFAAGYSEDVFRKLKLPDSMESVEQQLGAPLSKSDEFWFYSRSPSSTNYRHRFIRVQDGVAVERLHEFYVD